MSIKSSAKEKGQGEGRAPWRPPRTAPSGWLAARAAVQLGERTSVVGIDMSRQMLEVAQERSDSRRCFYGIVAHRLLREAAEAYGPAPVQSARGLWKS